MAGISLVYSKKQADHQIPALIEKMTVYHKLSLAEFMHFNVVQEKIGAGVVTLKDKTGSAKYHKAGGIESYVDGTIFIDEEIKTLLKKKHAPDMDDDVRLLPYLWMEYGEESWRHILGWFNWMIVDSGSCEIVVINDRFGMLPCYYAETPGYLLLASKYTSFLAAGLVNAETDPTILLQYIAFAYPLSDRALLRNIHLLPSASILKIGRNGLTCRKYWDVNELIFRKNQIMKAHDSIPFVHDALTRVLTRLSSGIDFFAVTLTGGWDGRLVLSFLDKIRRNNFFLYSHGSESNDDVTIPMKLSADLGYDYTPVLLDDNYLKIFSRYALDNLRFSEGLRPISRTHYLYSSEILGKRTQTMFSGNCGSNIIKSIVRPSTLYNSNILRLFQADNAVDEAAKIFEENMSGNFLNRSRFNKEMFVESIKETEVLHDHRLDQSQRFYHFLLSSIERKYYGAEIATYAHNLYNFSPFIDFEFIDAITKTPFFGAFSDFRAPGKLKMLAVTRFYGHLMKMNNEKLAQYPTNRGFALTDLDTIPGMIRSAFRYWEQKKRKHNPNANNFNFRKAVVTFSEANPVAGNEYVRIPEILDFLRNNNPRESLIAAYSWSVWIEDLTQRIYG